ncbi:MAG: T9SS type A sorting domain-containing protein [Bacteroidetes bacterium]|nr:T9SS type A sorting domain-containing protein [Bacteroidota bacterium]
MTSDTSGNIYVLSANRGIGFRVGELKVKMWNGLFWVTLPSIPVSEFIWDFEHELIMSSYQNQVIIAGSFKTNNGAAGATIWNGQSWEAIGGGLNTDWIIHDEMSVNHLVSDNKYLIAAGDFDLADNKKVRNLAWYDGVNWNGVLADNPDFQFVSKAGDSVFVKGNFNSVNGILTNGFVVFCKGKWFASNYGLTKKTLDLLSLNGNLIAATDDGFYRRMNGNWQLIGSPGFAIKRIISHVQIGNDLFVSGEFTDPKGEAATLIRLSDSETQVVLHNDYFNYLTDGNLFLAKGKDNVLFAGGDCDFSSNSNGNSATKNILMTKPGFSAVTGFVYKDDDGNCQRDQTETGLNNVILSVNNGSYYTSTDAEGKYMLFVPNNVKNQIDFISIDGFTHECTSATRIVQTGSTDSLWYIDYALKPRPEAAGIETDFTSASGFIVKHGLTGTYFIHVKSANKFRYPLNLILTRDERLTEFTSSLNLSKSTDKILNWKVDHDMEIRIDFPLNPLTIKMGDTLKFRLSATDAMDWTRSENLNQEVVSAFDPNDKQCDKKELLTGEKILEYNIRFQNLGTAPATDVHIVDTIDALLPIDFIQILGNSHFEKYSTAYKVRGHAIIWSFKVINLPPLMLTDDEKSSGFVNYKSGLSDDIKVGQVIENTAYIYFDFQPAVVTNTTSTKVVEYITPTVPDTRVAVVYPNPAGESITITTNNSQIRNIGIYASDGKLVRQISDVNKDLESVSIDDLCLGIYWIRIEHSLGVETFSVMHN